ncbi:class I SAM-dependent methyltransferase [Clostridium sp. Sa3CUN1]|uniref:Class I SAM-dependent methyltransferase n=1 Tax=Clostridium gallinarum TaxID=2762246 RepID=A0ABR8Q326_9CLOT|nr:class I SAM-dependent methyltransferase [Clostridium gallinarum]MBD7914825.1 class I SAM-dependent methyltransferase [Clostridium gallinarum]
MYRYVGNISDLSHYIIKDFVLNKEVAIDATLGNGYDTDFLSSLFKKVYTFDIQKEACDNYSANKKDNVEVINDSHHLFKKYINEKVDCIMYNLGFLPGGDKSITTLHKTSLKSIKEGLEILKNGGIMTICIYRGHSEGKIEESCILEYLKTLPKNQFGVMVQTYLNRQEISPLLVVIEKK